MEDPPDEGEELPEVRRNAGAGGEDAAQEVGGGDVLLDEGAVVEESGIVAPVLIGVDAEEPLDAVAGRVVSHACGTGSSSGVVGGAGAA